MKKNINLLFIAFFLSCSTISCSLLKSPKDNPLVVNAVVNVAAVYLRHLIVGNTKGLSSVAHWDRIYSSGKSKISQTEFNQQLASIQNRWTIKQHPLYGLEILDINIDGNEAEVVFRKAGNENYPKISVLMEWGGNSWFVVEDSLFGKEKQIATWQKDHRAFKTDT